MLTVQSIPAFNDNYIWLIHSPDNRCVVVDPGDAAPVIEVLESQQLKLEAILITHHHHDHIGGISELKRRYPHINIVAPAAEPIPGVSQSVEDGDQVEIFDERFMVIGVPGIPPATSRTWVTRSCSVVIHCSPPGVVAFLKVLPPKCITHYKS